MIKLAITSFAIAAAALAFGPGAARAQPAGNCIDVSIDSIMRDVSINGHVAANMISPTSRVVVYVHTDQWYIHPYVGQGDGLSWASIDGNGRWTLQTVKRQFSADQVAAFVVATGTPTPAFTNAPVVALRPLAQCVKVLRGQPNDGDL